MFHRAPFVLLALLLTNSALAHPAPSPIGEALQRRVVHNVNVQRSIQKRCGVKLAKRKAERLAQRDLLGHSAFPRQNTQNGLCVLTPEVTQGPNYIPGELVRQNISESQAGVPLEIDMDFIDITTCNPVPNAWVDLWHVNATGFFSGYATAPSGADEANAPNSTDASAGADTPASLNTTAPTDNEDFMRGVSQADDQGHAVMHSVVPGWYSGRATHMNVKVYASASGSEASNGTFVAGTAVHTGQLFFDDTTMAVVGNMTPYNTNSVERLAMTDDQWYAYENAAGFDASMDIEMVVGGDMSAGIIGSVTIALNMSNVSPET